MERVSGSFLLLDRDGTLIVEKNYLSDPDEVELLPGVVVGLGALQRAGFQFILLTNQSGVGRGLFTVRDVDLVHARLREILRVEGIELAGIYVCPHAPADNCACRKPRPKLALDAAADFGFDLRKSWMIGDKQADVELAGNIGARAILVRTGYGKETEASGVSADYIVDDLLEASKRLLPGSPS